MTRDHAGADHQQSLREALECWAERELANLAAILEITSDTCTIDDLEARFKWLYHSRTRALASSTIKDAASKIESLLTKRASTKSDIESEYQVPTYSELVSALASELKVREERASTEDLEEYISHEIIVEALSNMRPAERRDFFYESVSVGDILSSADIDSSNLRGPMTTMAMLGAAQASGMSVYLASTTALGFLTHAVGITLPFAAYTGMTSTIAFLIGPAGWLAAAGWGFWRLTGPEWKILLPAVLYIISNNERIKLRADVSEDEARSIEAWQSSQVPYSEYEDYKPDDEQGDIQREVRESQFDYSRSDEDGWFYDD